MGHFESLWEKHIICYGKLYLPEIDLSCFEGREEEGGTSGQKESLLANLWSNCTYSYIKAHKYIHQGAHVLLFKCTHTHIHIHISFTKLLEQNKKQTKQIH